MPKAVSFEEGNVWDLGVGITLTWLDPGSFESTDLYQGTAISRADATHSDAPA